MNRITNRNKKQTTRTVLAGITLAALLIALVGMVSACSKSPEDSSAADLKIVTTMFVSYDFARSIAGDQAEVRMLMPAGADVHAYEPSPQDIILLNEADLFIYNGGSSEAWVDRLLGSEEINPDNTLRMMDFVDLREEVTSGIIQVADDHDHDHAGTEGHGPVDEHIWTSPLNAIAMSAAIENKLVEMDAVNKESYEENFSKLEAGLKELHERFLSIVAAGARDYIVVADRFPLIYFTAEYGLKYYAAYEACAAESEPAPKTVTALIDLVRENNVPYIFTIEFSNERLANQIAAESGAEKLLFHTVHNVTQAEIDRGVSYLGLMQQNADNLEKALGR